MTPKDFEEWRKVAGKYPLLRRTGFGTGPPPAEWVRRVIELSRR
jgi:hypothetical protein